MGSYVSSTPNVQSNLHNRIVIVTGANRGIGFHVAKQLYELGATVYLGCRREEDGTKAIKEIRAQVPASSGQIKWLWVDLSTIQRSKDSAEGFLKVENSLDILVNNAAISDKMFEINEDGIEIMMAVNYFGTFVLTMTLLDLMKQTSTKPGSDVRIVNVSSSAHDMHARGNPSVTFTDPAEFSAHFPPGDYDSWGSRLARYGRSKLGITLFTSELQERLDNQESSIIAVSLHPGNVATVSALKIVAGMPFFGIIARAICQLVFMSEPEGAGNVVFAAASPNVRAEGIFKGRYLGPGGSIIVPSKYAQDTELSKRLWETTERVVRSRNVI